MTEAPLRVGVIGARGRMGAQTCQSVVEAPDMDLVAAVGGREWLFSLADADSQVVVDFSHPDVVMEHIRFCLDNNINVVAGTSGFDQERLDTITDWLQAKPELGVIVVPNFAIGAVLAARFAREAARFFESVEIIELHHAGKADAPSGTAAATARAIAAAREQAGLGPGPDATTIEQPGARGASVDGIRVHSVRLPGLVAHQEVILGTAGETLTIRHDSLDRVSFMPGVLTAIRSVPARPGLTLGSSSCSAWSGRWPDHVGRAYRTRIVVALADTGPDRVLHPARRPGHCADRVRQRGRDRAGHRRYCCCRSSVSCCSGSFGSAGRRSGWVANWPSRTGCPTT
ncbi:MAG: 4-hydroxy-tetrahydrodipicolinate reductase [Nakamurella multipartita]